MKNYYTCVVYSGSTCMCHALQHKSHECGHKHRTAEAAQKCLAKLQNWSKDGCCSATWYKGQVVEMEPKHDTEVISRPICDDDGYYTHDELTCAYDVCTC